MPSTTPFPIALYGHHLKYAVECIAKIFFPLRKFDFMLDPPTPPAGDNIILSFKTNVYVSTLTVITTLSGAVKTETRVAERLKIDTSREDKETCEGIFSDMLFLQLRALTGIDPPWGSQTGIRPVKKIQPLLRTGQDENAITRALTKQYHMHPDKIHLAYETAVTQEPLLAQTPKNSVSLYISIPFCPTRCHYCSFVSHSIESAARLIPDYVKALCRELAIWGEIVRALDVTVDTVYMGGGTPTVLEPADLTRIFETVEANFDLSHLREYCVEAGRPDTITPPKLEAMRAHGVSRLAVNPQTMQDSILENIGRRHTVAQVYDAFKMAREAGFHNINMDIIAGLPDDTPAGFSTTLDKILDLSPEGITIHALTLKRAATLYAEGERQLKNPVAAMVDEGKCRLEAAGYAPYYMYRQKNTLENLENVGYAREGFASLYNILIMDESQPIFGAGCGASTKITLPNGKIERVHNYKFPYEYVNNFEMLMEKKRGVYETAQQWREAGRDSVKK